MSTLAVTSLWTSTKEFLQNPEYFDDEATKPEGAPWLNCGRTLVSGPSKLAERVGFEPTVPLRGHSLSRRAHSAALAPLRCNRSSRYVNREQLWKPEASRLEAELTVQSFYLQSPDEMEREK